MFTGVLSDAGLPGESFDAVTMWDVIEHLNDPFANLCEVWRVLKPGGLFALSTGDIGSLWARLCGGYWQLLTPPQHLFYFNRQSMEKVAERTGFEVQHFTYPGKMVSMEFLGFKLQEAFGLPLAPMRWLTSLPGIRNLRTSVNMRDIFTCIAFKSINRMD